MDLSLLVLLVSFIGTLDARNVRRANRRPGRQLPEPTTTEQPMDPMVFMNTVRKLIILTTNFLLKFNLITMYLGSRRRHRLTVFDYFYQRTNGCDTLN